jgi:hypothetical protein
MIQRWWKMYEISVRSADGMIIDRGKDKLSEINISLCQLVQHASHNQLHGNEHLHSWWQEYICPEIWTENSKDVYRSSLCVHLTPGRQKKDKSADKSAEDSSSAQQRHVADRFALWHEQNNTQHVFHFQKCVSIDTTYFFTFMSLALNLGPNMTNLVQILTHPPYTRPNHHISGSAWIPCKYLIRLSRKRVFSETLCGAVYSDDRNSPDKYNLLNLRDFA